MNAKETYLEKKALNNAMQETNKRNKLMNPNLLASEQKRKEMLGIKDKEFEITLIQVEFPSKYVLESRFHPKESIDKLFEIIEDNLNDDIKIFLKNNKNTFDLILPPNEKLKRNDLKKNQLLKVYL